MILQSCFTLGLLLGVRVLAADSQHPISSQNHGIQTSSDCHNAASFINHPPAQPKINPIQCTELVTVLGEEKAFYGSLPLDFKDSFYCTRQRDVTPACVLRPSTSQDVSEAVKAIVKHSCNFAVKSGGHAMFEGASNADGGITIDLVNLDGLELSEDLMTARLGPGNRWGRVYEFLEERDRVVVGGRVGGVGVGGFMLGGK
jgi:hypothetical protein